MGGKSKTSAAQTTTTTNTQNVSTETFGAEDISGTNIQGIEGNVSIVATDAGAVSGALDFASDALGTVEDGLSRSLDTAGDIAGNAFDFAGDAQSRALDTVDRGLDASFDFGNEAFDFGRDSLASVNKANESLGQAIAQVGSLSRSDTSQSLEKIVMYVAGAVAVGLVAFAIFKRGK